MTVQSERFHRTTSAEYSFSTSPKGAKASAAAYSVIQTALTNGINARDYLTQVFAGDGKARLPFETE